MSNKKKRTKKYNALKSLEKTTEAALSNIFAIYVGSHIPNNVILWDARKMKMVAPTSRVVRAITSVKHRWSTTCAVVCRSQTGQEYIQTKEIVSEHPYFQWELQEVLTDEHRALIKEVNPMHACNVAWAASVRGEAIDHEAFSKIIEKMGGWRYPTQPEADKREDLQSINLQIATTGVVENVDT